MHQPHLHPFLRSASLRCLLGATLLLLLMSAYTTPPLAESPGVLDKKPILAPRIELLSRVATDSSYELIVRDENTEALKKTLSDLQHVGNLAALRIIFFPDSFRNLNTEQYFQAAGGWDALRKYPKLTTLRLSGVPATALEKIVALPRLSSLAIEDFCYVTGERLEKPHTGYSEAYQKHFACLETAKHLEHVSLPSTAPGDALGHLSRVQSLKSVSLTGDSPYRDSEWDECFDMLLNKPGLVQLEVGDVQRQYLPYSNDYNYMREVVAETDVEILRINSPIWGRVEWLDLSVDDWYYNALSRFKSRPYPALRVLEVSCETLLPHGHHVEVAGVPHKDAFYGEEIAPTDPQGETRYTGLRLLRNLESLTLSVSPWIRPELLFPSLASLPKFRTLKLQACPGVSIADDFIALTKSESLEELDLTNCRNLTDDCMRQIAEIPNLKRLTIDGCYRVTAVGVGHLMRAKHIEYLSWNNAENADDAAMLVIMKHLKSLTKLHLDPRLSPLTEIGRRAIAERGNWIHLTLPGSQPPNAPKAGRNHYPGSSESGFGWNDELMGALAKASPNLSYLSLDGKGVTEAGFAHLAACKVLESINLTGGQLVGGMVAPSIAVAIASIPSLKQFAAYLPRQGDPSKSNELDSTLMAQILERRKNSGLELLGSHEMKRPVN